MIEQVVQSISVLEEAPDLVSGRWPFQSVADRLVLDCLDPTWETRHGAALALREILSCQAFSAAVHGPIEEEPTGNSHNQVPYRQNSLSLENFILRKL